MHKLSSHPKVSLLKFLRTSHLSPLFKTTSNVSYPRERIKISGCTFEFKSNLNSNAKPTHPYPLVREKRRGVSWFLRGEFTREIFSRVKYGTHKIRPWRMDWLVAHSNSNFLLNLNGQPTYFYPDIWHTKVGVGWLLRGENLWDVASREFKYAQKKWGGAGRKVKVVWT